MNPSAVWITGVGTCTPLGDGYEEFSRNLLAGRSTIRPVTGFSVAEHPSQIASQVERVPCPPGEDPEAFARLPRLEQLLRYCCRQALHDAGLWERRGELRIGLVMGMGAEWHLFWEAEGLAQSSPTWQPPLLDTSLLERTRDALGLTGPLLAVSAACASGNVALAQARTWLRLGWADVCLAGACDMCVTPMSLAGFGNLRALSRRNAEPGAASRPFDRGRDGFVMGEGGAVFVLEKSDDARPRSAPVYAEVAGFGASSDAFHMVIPGSNPAPGMTAMRRALDDAGVAPAGVDHVNAHATSTPVGDIGEARVLAGVFGEDVGRIPVSATKSLMGHLLTGAAAVEALACIVALKNATVPPTLNLDDPDPECRHLCHVPHAARPHPVRVTASNSFGFGGSNTCLVLRAA